jgi:hypothetical protein
MSSTFHEIDLVVGSMIRIRPDEDREAFEEEQEIVAQVQDKLREEGINVDLLSQPGAELWESGIESLGVFYQLTRLAIHIEHGDDIAHILQEGPVLDDETVDSAVIAVWDNEVPTRFPHLVNLQDTNSYYLPVDFEQPLWLVFEMDESDDDDAFEDDDDAAFFGSSVRLQRELTEVAEMLQQHQVPPSAPVYGCLATLQEATAQSLSYGLPIIVW